MEVVVDLGAADPEHGLVADRFVLDDRFAYVDTNRGLYRAPKCGGSAVRIAENDPGQYSASGIVQDATSIYLAASAPVKGGFVRRIAKDGSGAVDLASSSGELFGLALANDRLYWVEKTASSGIVRARSLGGAAVETMGTVPIAYSYGPFVADASGVTFFALNGSNYGTFYARRDGAAFTSAGDGSAPFEIVSAAGGALYFTYGHTGVNGVARLPGGSRVADAVAPYGLAERGGSLYWSDMSAATVSRCTITDGSCTGVKIVASGEDDPRHVAVDDLAVYWVTRRGTVKRAPR